MSPLQKIKVNGDEIYVKRDDVITDIINGNKARKLKFLMDLDPNEIQKVVSFGGIQSNFMLALAKLAYAKKWKFDYYSKAIPSQLRQNPIGNYYYALQNNMRQTSLLIEPLTLDTIQAKYANEPHTFILNQGGKQPEAELGFIDLSQEIKEQVKAYQLETYSIFIPSGTGVSAYFLQKHLYPHTVYTTACVGSTNYLIEQIQQVNQFNATYLPQILEPKKKFQFGKPHIELIQCYQKLYKETNIEFDLLYDPIGWITVLENIHKIKQPVIYIHCGGTEGNESMLKRYNYLQTKKKL